MLYQETGFDSLEECALHVIPSHNRLADHAEAVAHGKGLPHLVGPPGGMRLQGAKGGLLYWQHPMQLCLYQSINHFTFLVFRTHQGSQQTTTGRMLRTSNLNDTIPPATPIVVVVNLCC